RGTRLSARSWPEICWCKWNSGRCSTAAKAERVVLREIGVEDAAAVARLSGELGYPVAEQQMAVRIRAQMKLADHTTYIAAQPDGTVVGWIDIGITHHLQADPYAEIGGFVVSGDA